MPNQNGGTSADFCTAGQDSMSELLNQCRKIYKSYRILDCIEKTVLYIIKMNLIPDSLQKNSAIYN